MSVTSGSCTGIQAGGVAAAALAASADGTAVPWGFDLSVKGGLTAGDGGLGHCFRLRLRRFRNSK